MRVVVAILVVLSSVRATARAGDDPIAKVRALYDSGTTHYNLGEYKEALADYKEAYRLKHDPAFLFNIGQAARMIGDHEESVRSYRAYLREARSTPNRVEVQRFIDEEEAAAAAKRKGAPPTGVESPQLPTPYPMPAKLHEPQQWAATPAPAAEPPRSRTPIIIAVAVAAVVVIGAAVGIGVAVASAPHDPMTRFGTVSVVFP
jgi:hypothetical protein